MAAAYDESVAEAQSGGALLVVDETSSRPRSLFAGVVPARSTLEYSYGSGAGGRDYSLTVGDQGRVVASWGHNPRDGRWSTLGAAGAWAPAFMQGTALTPTTAVTGMDKRLDMDTADGATLDIAVSLALPPGTATGGRAWTGTKAVTRGALTTVTARARSKSCTYPSISITLRAGLIESSDWTAVCKGAGTVVRHSQWRYPGGYVGAPAGAITQEQAIASSANPTDSRDWQAIAAAANATAAARLSDITSVRKSAPGSVEHHVDPVTALALLDSLIRSGHTMIVRPFADGGSTHYMLTNSGSIGYVPTVNGLEIGGGGLTIGPDGLITTMNLSYRKGSEVDSITTEFVK